MSSKPVLAIKHDAQIAYEETTRLGLSQLILGIVGEVRRRRKAVTGTSTRLNVPLKLRPLPFVNRAHRRPRPRSAQELGRHCAKRALAHDRLSHGFSELNCTRLSTLEPIHSGAALMVRPHRRDR